MHYAKKSIIGLGVVVVFCYVSICGVDACKKAIFAKPSDIKYYQIVLIDFAFCKFLSAVINGAFLITEVADIMRSAGSLFTSFGSVVDFSAISGVIP